MCNPWRYNFNHYQKSCQTDKFPPCQSFADMTFKTAINGKINKEFFALTITLNLVEKCIEFDVI